MNHFLTRKLFLISCISVLLCSGARAQTGDSAQNQQKRLKLGLVLSGGGARGLAHIGVLKWLEEHRVPVDYLAGTSMGGLVGGMYSMGMTPDEMTSFIKGINWEEAFASVPKYEDLPFRRKEDRRTYQVALQLGAKHGISLPTGLSTGQYIDAMIARVTLPYSNIATFDDLPIPYRCMATDFLDGKPVTMKDGSLATAMRATMSIPGVFPPVDRDGKVLVDGYLLNNIPTDAMREMKPDIVVAVDVGTPLGDLKAIQSFGGILGQANIIMTLDSDRRNLRLADVIIAPELGDHSTLNFSRIDEVIALGYQGAGSKAAILEKFSLDDATWQQYLSARKAKTLAAVSVPDEIQITGVNEKAQGIIRAKLERFAGKPLDTKDLETVLTRTAAEGRYQSLVYRMTKSQSDPNRNVLVVTVKEKSYAPPTVDFSIAMEASDIDDLHFSVGTRFTLFDVGKYGSEWRNDFRIGYRSLLASEYLYPLGQKGLFAAPRAYFSRGIENIFSSEGARTADYQANRSGIGMDLGFRTRRSELRTGYEIGRFNADVHTGTPEITSVSGKVSLARVRWAFDSADSATIPSRGLRFSTEGRWVMDAPLSADPFPRGKSQ